jgi:hypothetical protein
MGSGEDTQSLVPLLPYTVHTHPQKHAPCQRTSRSHQSSHYPFSALALHLLLLLLHACASFQRSL